MWLQFCKRIMCPEGSKWELMIEDLRGSSAGDKVVLGMHTMLAFLVPSLYLFR